MASRGTGIDTEVIRDNWEDLLRLAGSLKLGRIHAGAIMRVLQVKDRPTTLARALAELGRIIKTLPLLGYIDSKEKRRRILTQLNRQEFRHRLARRVCHGDRGEIRKAYRQEQEEQLGALGLTLNAIALWNSIYIQAAIEQLTREGWTISEADIARVSPLAFKHINFLGRYAFDLPRAVAEGALRPLRKPYFRIGLSHSLMTVHRTVQTHGPLCSLTRAHARAGHDRSRLARLQYGGEAD